MIGIEPIGEVVGGRAEPIDDHWAGVEAEIRLDATRFAPEALAGLAAFSHLVVVYSFHKVGADEITSTARHPRGRKDWPKVGIFAQRGKGRPNRLGVSVCEIVAVEGLVVRVRWLDAIDGSPVVDLKPYMSGFAPRATIREPGWAQEIMADYW
ncbi:MAG TPA: SAM-dependent methyltransferase [Hyphomicrobiales bacterium]|mgnify:FL=1|nr:SAM-dependent methyltransferase [Hyphomicrobiales bacterium]